MRHSLPPAAFNRSSRLPRSLLLALRSTLLAGVVACGSAAETVAPPTSDLSLNGTWQATVAGQPPSDVTVPGLAGDPTVMSPGTLRLHRTVALPAGDWNQATLILGGARFAPAVAIDGDQVASSEGGMAPVELPLRHAHVAPGRTLQLEIALQSLRDLDPGDASVVPAADRWRSDVSSGLWDGVSLHFSRDARIVRMVPWTDFSPDRVALHWTLDAAAGPTRTVRALVLDDSGQVVAESAPTDTAQLTGVSEIPLHHACSPWSPETPRVYRLRLVVTAQGRELDRRECHWGLRDFRAAGLQFALNGAPVQLRGATVVWHRWLRDPQARTLAWDTAWFEKNILRRLKDEGGNFLRFHLGLPPEALLDQCDRDGLMVQIEWPFFHGVKAAPASMTAQWRAWLDVALRHPCAVLIHPWNETEGDELTKAWAALNTLLPEYPPLVIAHRDSIPVHKYWWSIFENLGLYYDSAAQFGQPIMVDEFGGNYLDYRGNPGAYPTVRESFLRFLGRDPTPARRLQFQAEASARVAEYWRRLGAAGVAPFCTLSSPDDGNTWFLGSLADGQPKPVWSALTAAYSPQSVSLEIWDRNFVPGEPITVPVSFFNDRDTARELHATVRLVPAEGSPRIMAEQVLAQSVPAHATRVLRATLPAPVTTGEWRLEAELTDRVEGVTQPIVSSWAIRTLSVELPASVRGLPIGIADDEPELAALLAQNGLPAVQLADPAARVLLLSATGWRHLIASPAMGPTLAAAVKRGAGVVLLDLGPGQLGAGYQPFDPAQLEGAPRITTPRAETHDLFAGVSLEFREAAEPESHLHPASADDSLWRSLPRESTWLWNGLRGGLVVPAEEMDVRGLAPSALQALWQGRGAPDSALLGGPGFAYQLAGYYAFSGRPDDKATIAQLRAKVKQLADDAPALQNQINPGAPIETVDLGKLFSATGTAGEATALVPLASCGKNLSRTPIVELHFGPREGKLILSQALTAGRLQRHHAAPGLYGLRYDPAAEQFVLNVIARVVAAP